MRTTFDLRPRVWPAGVDKHGQQVREAGGAEEVEFAQPEPRAFDGPRRRRRSDLISFQYDSGVGAAGNAAGSKHALKTVCGAFWQRHGERLNKMVINPSSRSKSLFDLFILICVLYTVVTAPFKVAYQTDFLQWIDAALNVLFVLDIFVQAITGYYRLGGTRFPVLELPNVVKNYARTWFLVDLLAAIPFEMIAPSLVRRRAQRARGALEPTA
jgi:hypothetical protein